MQSIVSGISPSLLNELNPIHWPTLVVVATRLSGVMLIAPLWSNSQVPTSLRAAMIALLSLSMLPLVQDAALPDDWALLPIPMLTELIIGLSIGFVGAVLMYGIALAGQVMSLQMGLNIGEALGFGGTATSTGVGELKTMLTLVLFVTLDGHVTLITALAESFTRIPPAGAIDLSHGTQALLAAAGSVFEIGVRAAAPVIASLLLGNIGMAIMSRAVPQLNAMSVAFPVTISLGLIVIGLSLPFFGSYVGQWIGSIGPMASRNVGAFVPGTH